MYIITENVKCIIDIRIVGNKIVSIYINNIIYFRLWKSFFVAKTTL